MADPRFMLDTNICIYLLDGRSDAAAVRLSRQVVGTVVTSSIVFAEVMLGMIRLGAETAAEAFFAQVPVLPFDRAAGEVYAGLDFRRANFDRLIAAHALALDLVLVTNDEHDFADVPGLKVENWATV